MYQEEHHRCLMIHRKRSSWHRHKQATIKPFMSSTGSTTLSFVPTWHVWWVTTISGEIWWTLSPSGGVLRFKSHDERKMNTLNTRRRWARGEGETDWDVIGG